MNKLLSRKFILSISVFIAATLLVVFNIIEASSWIELAKWLILAYSGANLADHANQTIRDKGGDNNKDNSTDET